MLSALNNFFTQNAVGVGIAALIAACLFELVKHFLRKIPARRHRNIKRKLKDVKRAFKEFENGSFIARLFELFAFLTFYLVFTAISTVLFVSTFVATYDGDVLSFAVSLEQHQKIALYGRYLITGVYAVLIVTSGHSFTRLIEYARCLTYPEIIITRIEGSIAQLRDSVSTEEVKKLDLYLSDLRETYQRLGLGPKKIVPDNS